MLGWKADKDRLNGIKTIRVNGMRFKIRRVNPLLDFPPDRMPSLFTEFQSQRPKSEKPMLPSREQLESSREMVLAFIQAGVIEPELVPIGKADKHGKEDGLTAEDLFRDPDMGTRLYFEILNNSLNVFTGTKGLFFSLKTRLLLFISLRLSSLAVRLTSSDLTKKQPI